jgi:hypothetical protein
MVARPRRPASHHAQEIECPASERYADRVLGEQLARAGELEAPEGEGESIVVGHDFR